ncbi:hypothetical protein [Planktomarina temperata]|jgi:hypothetical protein|uniref:hypothetical protein n=1 Tax=Planktomarina temperata TaxID=1284658 RepID=UPI003F6951B7
MQIEIYDKPAERKLIAACRKGRATIISRERPEKGSADNTIRAGLIRALLLGTGDCTPPVRGLQIRGAWITGKLDLAGEALPVPLGLVSCTLEEDVMLRDCTLPALYLSGTHLPKLDAHRLHCNGSLHLQDGFQATGLVNLASAKIGGQLACTGGKFLAEDMALNCDAITVGASVFLGQGFTAKGEVNLLDAKIDGNLSCAGGKFLAEDRALNCNGISVGADVFLQGEFDARGRILLNRFEARGTIALNLAVIAGNLGLLGATLTKGLDAQGMRVRAGFLWGDVTDDGITVNLFNAQVGTLYDTPDSWKSVTHLRLSSFRYERIESGMDVQERLDWLAKHDATALRFTPQPYVQLANVLRRQGFAGDAARVLVRREDKQRLQEYLDGRAAHRQSRNHLNGDLRPAAASLWADGKFALNVLKFAAGYLFGLMFGYGHQPARVLPWIAAILGITIWFAQQIHIHGQFAPISSVVLTSQDWLDSFPTEPLHPSSPLWRAQMDAWAQTTSGRDYTSFSAFLYALDLFIPLDALGQEKNWAPSAERGGWGDLGHRLRWLVQMAGWVITAIGAAVLTGLIGRRD